MSTSISKALKIYRARLEVNQKELANMLGGQQPNCKFIEMPLHLQSLHQ